MTLEDLATLKSLQKEDHSMPQFVVEDKCSRRASGTAITGVVIASAALLIAIAAWVFAGIFTGARTRGIEKTAEKTSEQISTLTSLLATERSERLAGTPNFSQTIDILNRVNNTQGQSASATATSTLAQLLGNLNPLASAIDNSNCGILRVSRWESAKPCDCRND